MSKINTIIFDLGGVLIDWNPAYVFDTFFDDEEKKKFFFENVCTPDWNEQQDAGRKIQEATNDLVALHPDWEEAIRAYYGRWTEMLGGPINETVDIFRRLKNNSHLKFYALTNWSGELFPIALQRYEFLKWFDGIVVSGDEKTRKPFPEIYKILLSRFTIHPEKALFIDDSLRNIKGAQALGINCIHFQSAKNLPQQLDEWNITDG
jgi:2-haloacid dehalogenase